MSCFDAFLLPGFDAADPAVEWSELRPGPTRLRYPVLTREDTLRLAGALRAKRTATLARRPVREIARAVDAAAAELTRPGDLRDAALALLPETTRFSAPMVELVLDRMAADWRTDAIDRLLRSELGDAAALDAFVEDPHAGRRVRALGPGLTLNVFAGNVPGVAVTALVRCLLVKSAVIGKTAADDPVLAVLFARALARVDPDLADCVAVTYWPGGTGAAEDAAIEGADAVVVYGGAEVVQSVRRRTPAGVRVLEHGPRVSYGFITREALSPERARPLAASVALAAATFDQHGCVSLHGAFVERGSDPAPAEFARLVFDELIRLEDRLPTGTLTAQEAARIHSERARAEFEHIEGGFVLAGPAAGATVVFSDAADTTPSCLDRFLRVGAVDDLEQAVAALAPWAGLLQSAALAAPPGRREALAESLATAGFTRITTFDAMPWPPAQWHHDGASPLRELIRWVDLEADDAG